MGLKKVLGLGRSGTLAGAILVTWVVFLASCARQEQPAVIAEGPGLGTGQSGLVASSEKLGLQMRVIEPGSSKQATALGVFLSWTVQFERAGKPFSLDSIAITGGMPSHGHGMPTQPRVTAQLGEGRYLVEGLKFTMPGRWQLVFNIGSSLGSDRILLEFDVQH